MSDEDHLKWKSFWDDQAKVEDSHQAVRGEKVMSDEVQAFHDRKLVGMLAPDPGDHLLDAGCGTGDQAALFAPLVKRITAIDFSEAMAGRCRARLAETGAGNIEVETADVTALPFPDRTFDKAICIAVLQYLNPEEVDKALSELIRVVKPGGLLVVHVKDLWSGTGMMITFGRFWRGLLSGRPPLEYQYRTHWWYKKRLRRYATVAESYAYGTWTPFMPRRMMTWIADLETRRRFIQDRWPHGKEYFIAARPEG